jgi:hypothetical protein
LDRKLRSLTWAFAVLVAFYRVRRWFLRMFYRVNFSTDFYVVVASIPARVASADVGSRPVPGELMPSGSWPT